MKILEYIDPLVFFISLSIGIFLTYISTPTPKIVIKFPTPTNSGKIVYKDTAEMCYKYDSKEVECPTDNKEITVTNIQHVKNNDDKKESIFKKIKRKFF